MQHSLSCVLVALVSSACTTGANAVPMMFNTDGVAITSNLVGQSSSFDPFSRTSQSMSAFYDAGSNRVALRFEFSDPFLLSGGGFQVLTDTMPTSGMDGVFEIALDWQNANDATMAEDSLALVTVGSDITTESVTSSTLEYGFVDDDGSNPRQVDVGLQLNQDPGLALAFTSSDITIDFVNGDVDGDADAFLRFNTVPEPASSVLVGLGSLCLLGRQRTDA